MPRRSKGGDASPPEANAMPSGMGTDGTAEPGAIEAKPRRLQERLHVRLNCDPYDYYEIESFIMERSADEELSETEIAGLIESRFGLRDWNRNRVQYVKRYAREENRYRSVYIPHETTKYCGDLKRFIANESGGTLDRVTAAHTTEPIHIAELGTKVLLGEIRRHFTETGASEIHIAIAGGKTTGLMARSLVESLSFSAGVVPKIKDKGPAKTIHFYSLVGHMNCDNPLVDPNSLLVSLAAAGGRIEREYRIRYHSLPIPGILTADEYDLLIKHDVKLIRAALARKADIDIVVMSLGHWGEGHKSLYDYIAAACGGVDELGAAWEKTKEKLEAGKVIGDVAWMPISEQGAISPELPLRMLTMLNLDELTQLIEPGARPSNGFRRGKVTRGKAILLVSPCSGPRCDKTSKGNLLASIAKMKPFLATHIVSDWASIRDCVAELGIAGPGARC